MEIKIATSQPQDAAQVYKVFKETWLDTYINSEHNITKEDILSRYPEDKKDETIKKWEAFYQSINDNPEAAQTLVWVAKDNDTVLGVVTLDRLTPVQLGALYVLPEYQGQGVGKLLIEHFLSYIGNQPAQLKVASYNDRAIKFYEKYGFKLSGKVEDKSGELPSGKVIPEMLMLRD